MIRSIFTLRKRIPQSVQYYSVQFIKHTCMKNYRSFKIHSYTFLFISVVLVGLVGCKQSETKVEAVASPTELPVTSSSPEAVAAFNKGMEFLDVGNTQQ